MDFQNPLVIGHRGFSGQYPENTLLAFQKAIDIGADMVEFDVHQTKDGHLVVCHDADLSRTTSGSGKIQDLNLEAIREFDAGQGEKVPTLAELADLAKGKIGLQLEIKVPDVEIQLLEVLTAHDVLDQTYFSSFNHNALKILKQLNPSVPVATLESQMEWSTDGKAERGIKRFLKHAKAVDAWAIHPFFFNVTEGLVTEAHDHGYKINPWTVDSPEIIQMLLDMGVDAIITNVPDVLLRVLGRPVPDL